MSCLADKISSGVQTEFAEIAAVVPIVSKHQVVLVRHDNLAKSSAATPRCYPVLQNFSLHSEQLLLAPSRVTVLKVSEPGFFLRLKYPIVSGLRVDSQMITIPTYSVSR